MGIDASKHSVDDSGNTSLWTHTRTFRERSLSLIMMILTNDLWKFNYPPQVSPPPNKSTSYVLFIELSYTINSRLHLKSRMLEFQHMPNALCLSNVSSIDVCVLI